MKVEIDCDQQKISEITLKNLNAIDEIFEITQLVSDRIKHMHPSILFDMQKYYPEAWDIIDKHLNCIGQSPYYSFEEAELECLKKLIKIVKNDKI